MEKVLPNKWIRRAVFNLLNTDYNIYDTRVTGVAQPEQYILMTTQTNEVNELSKCEQLWNSSILLDFVDIKSRQGNPGSRLAVDDMIEDVRDLLVTNGLDLSDGGLEVSKMDLSFPDGITSVTDTEVVQRAFIRIELEIK